MLQVLVSPDEYDRITAPGLGRQFSPRQATNEYWSCIPEYKVTECPFCHQSYRAQIDTYSLANAPVINSQGNTFTIDFRRETQHCNHFLAASRFIHLNGLLPTELRYREFDSSEVPAIQPNLMLDDIESYAVLHALPVCKVYDRQFVPVYTLYFMTYFSDDPRAIVARWHYEVQQIARRDPEYYVNLLHNPHEPIAYDLNDWVTRGRLKWLDLGEVALTLRHGPAGQFPCSNIQGRKKGATYGNGVLEEHIV